MKKKILLGLFVLAGLFIITGCDNSNSSEFTKDGKAKVEFVQLLYKEPTDFVKKEKLIDSTDMKTFIYQLDNTDEKVSINLYYNKGKSYNYIEDSSTKYTEKNINGITWRIIHDDDFGVVTDTYYVVYNNDMYQIELNGIDKKPDMSSFMDEVSFK